MNTPMPVPGEEIESPIEEAVRLAGGQVALANAINKRMPDREKPIRQTHVYRWLNGTPVLPEVLLAIEDATGVTCERVRPDLAAIFNRDRPAA